MRPSLITATISHETNVPTKNAVEGEIFPLLKQGCLKLCTVSRLIKASRQKPIKLVPGVLNGDINDHSITLTLLADKHCVIARSVWGGA